MWALGKVSLLVLLMLVVAGCTIPQPTPVSSTPSPVATTPPTAGGGTGIATFSSACSPSGLATCQFSCARGDAIVVSGLGKGGVNIAASCGGVGTTCFGPLACLNASNQTSSAGTGTCTLNTFAPNARCEALGAPHTQSAASGPGSNVCEPQPGQSCTFTCSAGDTIAVAGGDKTGIFINATCGGAYTQCMNTIACESESNSPAQLAASGVCRLYTTSKAAACEAIPTPAAPGNPPTAPTGVPATPPITSPATVPTAPTIPQPTGSGGAAPTTCMLQGVSLCHFRCDNGDALEIQGAGPAGVLIQARCGQMYGYCAGPAACDSSTPPTSTSDEKGWCQAFTAVTQGSCTARLYVPPPSIRDPTTQLPVTLPQTSFEAPVSTSCATVATPGVASCVFACSPGDALAVSAQGAPGFAFAKRSVEAKCSGLHTTCEGYGGCTAHGIARIAVSGTGVCVAPVTGTLAQCSASGGAAQHVGPDPAPIVPPDPYYTASPFLTAINGASEAVGSPASVADYQGVPLTRTYKSGERVIAVNGLTNGNYYTLVENTGPLVYAIETRVAMDDATSSHNITGYVVFSDRDYSPGIYSVVQGTDGTGTSVLTFTMLPVSIGAQKSSSTQPQSYEYCSNGPYHKISRASTTYAASDGAQADGTRLLANAWAMFNLTLGSQAQDCSLSGLHVYPATIVYGGALNATASPSTGTAQFLPVEDLHAWNDQSGGVRREIVLNEGGIFLTDNPYTWSTDVSGIFYGQGTIRDIPEPNHILLEAADTGGEWVCSVGLFLLFQVDFPGELPCKPATGGYIVTDAVWLGLQEMNSDGSEAHWQDDPVQTYGPQQDSCGKACYVFNKVTASGVQPVPFTFRSANALSSDAANGYVHVNMELPQGANYIAGSDAWNFKPEELGTVGLYGQLKTLVAP